MITGDRFDRWDKYIIDTAKEQISEFKYRIKEYSEHFTKANGEGIYENLVINQKLIFKELQHLPDRKRDERKV